MFAFLAGTGAYLAGSRGQSRGDLAAFLATRGVWLIFLELTVVRLGLFFDPVSAPVILTVLWSIGASFVVLAGLVFLPSRVVGALGVLLIATHGLAGGLSSGSGDLRGVAGGRRASAATRLCCRCPVASTYSSATRSSPGWGWSPRATGSARSSGSSRGGGGG